MSKEPVFINSYGTTFRIDPPTLKTESVRLTISEPSLWEGDRQIYEARIFDVYISREAAKQLADTLTFLTDPVMQKILDPEADVTPESAAPTSGSLSLFAGIKPRP